MSISKVKEIRIELDYGIYYVNKSDLDEVVGSSAYMGLNKLVEARMYMGRYLFYLGAEDPYPNMGNSDNDIIERSADKVDMSIVEVNSDLSKVKHLKFIINGLRLGLEKIIDIKMVRDNITDARKKSLASKAIDSAISSLELSISYFGRELRDISGLDPDKYPSSEKIQTEDNITPENKEEKDLTDSIFEERAKRTTKKE